jgi:hypothetical protein
MSGFGGSSFSSVGNSSLSTFLSTLFEDEQVKDLELVVDNAKLDQSKSFLSLKLQQSEPKCKWNNLVRHHSDRDLRHGRKIIEKTSQSFSINSPSTINQRIGSDPNLSLRIPKRPMSPLQTPEKKFSQKAAIRRDSIILRIPLRLASPVTEKGRIGSNNATWDKANVREKKPENANMFFDIMMEAEEHAPKPKMRATLPSCLKDEANQEKASAGSSSMSSLSQTSPLSDNGVELLYNKIVPSRSSHQHILSTELRTTLISDLAQLPVVAIKK